MRMSASAAPILDALYGSSIAAFLAAWIENPTLGEKDQQTFDYYYRSYKRRFGPYLRHYYERQTHELMARIAARPGARVLEAGCGCGTEALWAAAKGASVVGLDISDELLSVARHRLELLERETGRPLPCTFQRGSVLDLAEDEPFDVVYLEQAFHHIEPRQALITKLARLVKPGGHLILSEANGWNPFLQWRLFRMRGLKTIVMHDGHLWGHERITVPWVLVKSFRPYRLVPVELRYFRALPNIAIADQLLPLERRIPTLLRPAFTHFNLILRNRGEQ